MGAVAHPRVWGTSRPSGISQAQTSRHPHARKSPEATASAMQALPSPPPHAPRLTAFVVGMPMFRGATTRRDPGDRRADMPKTTAQTLDGCQVMAPRPVSRHGASWGGGPLSAHVLVPPFSTACRKDTGGSLPSVAPPQLGGRGGPWRPGTCGASRRGRGTRRATAGGQMVVVTAPAVDGPGPQAVPFVLSLGTGRPDGRKECSARQHRVAPVLYTVHMYSIARAQESCRWAQARPSSGHTVLSQRALYAR